MIVDVMDVLAALQIVLVDVQLLVEAVLAVQVAVEAVVLAIVQVGATQHARDALLGAKGLAKHLVLLRALELVIVRVLLNKKRIKGD